MQEIMYSGEHLWLGQVGHFLVITSFIAALLSLYGYARAENHSLIERTAGWLLVGRGAFYTHCLALTGLMGLLFYAMYHHMYEFSYVFDHVSPELPLKYILSAFWEGQEGSFMLWMLWHAVLGILLIRTSRGFEAPVMAVFALAQAILMTMILGIHVPWGDETLKIGSSPFTLLRQINEAPIFLNADYLSLIKGRGLNPLLQNYWMTIHPPTLFLGFASTLVPFAFAVAGLWRGEHTSWLRPSMAWSLFSAGILGTGILMGSLWAYVALSFGGYWAWDPVENASLVPWMTLVAGIHVHLIARNTGYATRSVYFFYLITFVLILYSTFLTRSGILGDTSAHAFTEMGLEWQLLFLIGVFLVGGLGLWGYRYRSIPQPEREEAVPSREFWMFIGTLVLFFGAILITASTSLPVYNKIMTWFQPAWEGRVIRDVISHYNKYQMWIAFFMAMLSSFSIYLRYGGASWEAQRVSFLKRTGLHLLVAGAGTWATSLWIDYHSWPFAVLSFSGWYAMTASGEQLFTAVRRHPALTWSSMAHLGFGMMILGTLASGLNQLPISSNPFVFKGIFSEEDVQKYVQLIKGKPLLSQGHLLTYESDTLMGRERRYSIRFQQLDDSLRVKDEWVAHPTAMYANDFSKIAAFNPDTRHYPDRDIFTCIVGLPPAVESMEKAKKIEDTLTFRPFILPQGDSAVVGDYVLYADNIRFTPENEEYLREPHDAGLSLPIRIKDKRKDTVYNLEPAVGIRGSLMYSYPESVEEAGIRLRLAESNLESFFTPEDKLTYQEFTVKSGETMAIQGTTLRLAGFERNPKHPSYIPKEGDIAIAARLEVMGDENGEIADPVYVIRDNQPMSIKYYSPEYGLHVRFSNIDPSSETFTFRLAKDTRKTGPVTVEVATNVPRTDYLILQATLFPGINLFWVGCLLMMVGLCAAAVYRVIKKIQ